MRFSWKRLLLLYVCLRLRTPPLGLMRFSWKHFKPLISFDESYPPPLGLMRFSWKLYWVLPNIQTQIQVPPAWVNAV